MAYKLTLKLLYYQADPPPHCHSTPPHLPRPRLYNRPRIRHPLTMCAIWEHVEYEGAAVVLGYMGAGHFRMMLLMIMPLQSVLAVSEVATGIPNPSAQ